MNKPFPSPTEQIKKEYMKIKKEDIEGGIEVDSKKALYYARLEKALARFNENFLNRLMRVSGPNKEWEDGYNTMVEATRIWMVEAKDFISTELQNAYDLGVKESREDKLFTNKDI